MTDSTELLPVLQLLELRFHLQATRNNANIVDELLHDDFEETSRLGQRHDKNGKQWPRWKMETDNLQIFYRGVQLTMITEDVAEI
ncbi:MAG: hypothetical protein WCD24_05485 [Serratia inhibens]|uniref:hypothetical protein n=1 Tax=Serratia inhibens TaxID=2338073 RepID=UPI003C7B42DA